MTDPALQREREPLVVHVIPTAVARGAQREARALADRLDLPGTRCHRVLNLFAGPGEVGVDRSLDYPGGDRTAIGLQAGLILRLRGELRRLRPSMVVAHGGDALKYLVPAMTGRSVPLVYYAIGTFAAANRRAQLFVWRFLVRRADVVACEGEEVMAECGSLLRVRADRLALAPNGRDPEKFRPRDRRDDPRHSGPKGAPVVVFVGAFNSGKGPERFVEVVAGLRRRGLAFGALACGDGPLMEGLVGPSAEAGVELLGSRPDVDAVLREADVMVFPSRPTGEGMPGVLIEAGLSGVPVVATDVPGVRSIVEDSSTGFIVPVDDLRAMEDRIAKLLEDADLRAQMGTAARERCIARFTVDTVAAAWLSFLEPLLSRTLSSPHGRSGRDSRRARGL